MADTQWPRYQVFVQEKPGAPHKDVGSVHAPDAEIALLNARDVFARRPECVSMWVVQADAIYSKTIEELQNQPAPQSDHLASNRQMYYISYKTKPAGTQTLVGSLEANNPAQAMEKAIEKFSGKVSPLVWWVFPAGLVIKSDPTEIDSLYAPAKDKTFRMSTDFHTFTAMRKLKDKS